MSDLLKMMQELDGLDPHEEVETRETYVRAPFAWPGGKSRSLKYLLPHLPYRGPYIEPCGGSGIVMLNRKQSPLEVFNDRYSGITCFYRCIKDNTLREQLTARLDGMLHSREEFIWARDSWKNCTDAVERAARWFYMVRTSFGSIGRNWGRATAGFAMIGPKLRESLGDFWPTHLRMRDVQIENLDAIQCIRDFQSHDSVVYTDPDYVDSARGHYEHQMDRAYHCRLLETIFTGKGFHAISGYANDIYDSPEWKWTERYEWESMVTATPQAFDANNNKIDSGEGRSYAKEVLWIKDHHR